jgi:hypothetical protein
MALLTVGVVFFLTSNVGAAEGHFFANVIRAGGNSASAIVQVSDTAPTPAFTEKWCMLHSDNDKTMLATALTALSMGKTVYIVMDPALSVPIIRALYINE